MIYVCIPVHDEARTVGVLLWKIRKVMASFGRDYHIVVLDDASTDDTPATLDRYRTFLPLTVLRSEERLGYARAVERLLHEAVERAPYPKRDCAVVLQADFSEDPSHLETLVKSVEGGADIVAGAEGPDAPAGPRGLRFVRRVAPMVMGRAYQDAPVSDPLCGFRAYRVIVLKKALRDQDGTQTGKDSRWAANVELLGTLAPHARRIEEAPLELRYDLMTRESRFRPVRTLRDLFGVRGVRYGTGASDQAA